VEGSFRTDSFTRFIEGLLKNMQPYPAPNSVIVMDNCHIHKHPQIQALIEERGMCCEFLPPYSPDLNPIELAFLFMKYNLRRDGELVHMAMTDLSDSEIFLCLSCAIFSVTPKDSYGWFRYCGYL
jgi:transposase